MELRKVKIGRITCGILLILVGIALFISIFNASISIQLLINLWPIILIALGLETLYYSSRKEIESKFDFWCVLFLVFVIGIAFTGSIIHTGYKLVSDSDFVSNWLQNEKQRTYHLSFDDEPITIENLSPSVQIKIIESKTIETPYIIIDATFKDTFQTDRHRTFDVNYEKKQLLLLDNSKYLDSCDVDVYVSDKNNVIIY